MRGRDKNRKYEVDLNLVFTNSSVNLVRVTWLKVMYSSGKIMFNRRTQLLLFLVASSLYIHPTCCGQEDSTPASERIGRIPHSTLSEFQQMIRPDLKLSRWRQINWLTDVSEARRQAIAEDKPILFFTAADGNPIGRT